jgi:DNA adenine methylase
MLRRLGNKTKLLPKLLQLFPPNITYFIDMFMGSGAVTLAMAKRCQHVFANDLDADVFNLFMVVKDRKAELLAAIETMPVHEALFKHWKKSQEYDPVWKAVRFLILSNFGYMGNSSTLSGQFGLHSKKILLKNLKQMLVLTNATFFNDSFENILNKISFRNKQIDMNGAFIYADPPYLGTTNNYSSGFTLQDSQDLFKILTESGMRFAMSEFKNQIILDLAREYRLHVTELGERQTLKNRQTEILVTNYLPGRCQQALFSNEMMETN